jgi:PAS domain S-box-containing protein
MGSVGPAVTRIGEAAAVLRILVVEDSDADFELLEMLLANAGLAAQCVQVEDEPGMRAALAEGPWDIVIADHRLPRFSARAALATLQSVRPDIPFIIVSGSIGEDVAVEAMLAGADDYIMKSRLARLIPSIQRSIRAADMRRKRGEAEARLRESEARLRALAANVPGILLQMRYGAGDAEPRFIYASEGATRLLGVTPDEILADGGALLHLIEADDLATLRDTLATAASEQGSLVWEGRAHRRGDGQELWLRLSASPRRAEGDAAAVNVWDGIAIDVTALKQAEALILASREELRELHAHLTSIKEEERARIAREIHDDIGGTLTGMNADLAWLRTRYGADPKVAEKLASLSGLLESAMHASVRIARDLRPPVLDYGFAAAMQWQAEEFEKRTGITCAVETEAGDVELASDCATAGFRIFQELLTNIAKHANATRVSVLLATSEDHFALEVSDNGNGLADGERLKPGSFGIRGMRERARQFGGSFSIVGVPGRGTRASLHLPIRRSGE